jgi:transcriptional regulator with XRE-family HTH domain
VRSVFLAIVCLQIVTVGNRFFRQVTSEVRMARPSPTVRRRRLRSELRRLRAERGLTIEDVQERSGGDIRIPTLSRWETGERSVRPNDLRALLDIYGMTEGEERETLLTLCRQAKERGWWQSYGSAVPGWFQFYVGLESEASEIRQYASELVPGLLQTAEYYRTFLRVAPADDDIEAKIGVRMARQERLTAADDAPEYWAVLNEAVIRRTVGANGTMREQLEHLAELAALPNVTIQVLPFGAGVHPAMDGGFNILGFPAPATDPSVVYLENAAGSVYLEESAEVDRFGRMFSHIIAKALSPEDSSRLLMKAAASVGHDESE